jgi:uncharacterized protein YaeQ
MSFLAALIRFHYRIADDARQVFVEGELKTPQHLTESSEHLLARLISFAHCYHPELHFLSTEEDASASTLVVEDFDQTLLLWAYVGSPSALEIRRALGRQKKMGHCLVYFPNAFDEKRFVHQLRGSKTNWVEKLSFFRIDLSGLRAFLEEAEEHGLADRIEMDITLVDDMAYLSIDNKQYAICIEKIDIWESFQKSLHNSLEPVG